MSASLRRKILNDFIRKPRASVETILKDFFDNGKIRVERKDWDQVYSDAQSGLGNLIGGTIPITDDEWQDITTYIHKNFVSDAIMIVSPVFQMNKAFIVKSYRRNTKKLISEGQGIIDLEKYAVTILRKIMTNYFSTGKYKSLAKRVLSETASDQEYEHGNRQEPLFGSLGQYDSGGKGSIDRLRGTLKPHGGQVASGAKGTIVDKQLAAALKSKAIKNFNTYDWFSIIYETIFLKWAELFDYDSSVTSKDGMDKVLDEVKLQGLLLPKAYSQKMKTNKGIFDRAIRKEITKFLENRYYFASELMRLQGVDMDTAANLTAGSKNSKQRIEDASLKLIAAGLLDSISEEHLRNNKSSQLKRNSKPKRGVSKSTSKAAGRGSSSVKKTKSSVPAKKTRRKRKTRVMGGSPIALKELINQQLPSRILPKMQAPALVNRTGRFRHSAEVTNVVVGPRGGTQIDYTYQRNPYEVFEPGSGSPLANQYRDPRRIIGGTVREIAQEIMGKKFITIRRV